jgi:uncharacterized membrane protein
MRNDLIAAAYESEGMALRIYDSLQNMRKSPLMGLQNVVIISKSGAGNVSVHLKKELPLTPGTTEADILNFIVEIIFTDPQDEMVQELVEEGLDDHFLESFSRALDVNSSALLFLLSYSGMSDTEELLGTLALFKGRIYQTTLPQQTKLAIEKRIMISQ